MSGTSSALVPEDGEESVVESDGLPNELLSVLLLRDLNTVQLPVPRLLEL